MNKKKTFLKGSLLAVIIILIIFGISTNIKNTTLEQLQNNGHSQMMGIYYKNKK